MLRPANFAFLAPLRRRIPLLRYLRIAVVAGGFIPPSVSQELPFSQLTRLKMLGDPLSHAVILQNAPDLEAADLEFKPGSSEVAASMIRLPQLRRLYVGAQFFLDQLELPALEEIYMVYCPPAPFLSLIGRRLTIRLTTLRMASCFPPYISQILATCSTVQTLGVQILHSDSRCNDLLLDLTVRNNMCIGPNVDTIALGIDGANLYYGLLVNMVESRWRVPAQGGSYCRLRSVKLLSTHDSRLLSTRIEQRLEVLEREGLQVSVLQGSVASMELIYWRI
ncbi:hypothetical protein B0H19DRAFT_118495 [Mycena capillaripes]|nr:hypothetical protein B0H19DRAFT_118495 [Mycena capillaripes]